MPEMTGGIGKKYAENELYRLLTDMAGIPSVSPSRERENEIARFLFDTLKVLPYFREHPEDLRLLPLEEDPLGRHFLFAVVRAARADAGTILLEGHMDVVGVEACGALAPFAFSPEEYTRRLESASISDDARRDLGTGEWLFGRGVADMKSGLAAGASLLMEAAHGRCELDVNLALLAVPDEENNSCGMLSAAAYLARLQKEEGLRYLACIGLEPTFATGEEAVPSIYLGSIGKINPFFFCAGKETHVGEYYEGFGAAPILSQINLMLDGSAEYADSSDGRAYPPFGCMRQSDLRREYSATIMTRGFAFYSYLTARKLPGQILGEMRTIAEKALRLAIERHRRNSEAFSGRNASPPSSRTWKATVLAFEELAVRAEEALCGNFGPLLQSTLQSVPRGADERAKAIAVVEALVDACAIPGPLVVIGFLPPWYPHRANRGHSNGEKILIRVASDTVKEARKRFGKGLEIRPFFEGVSDLSYCGFQGEPSEMELFARNMPGWKTLYSLHTDALARLDIPVLNLGPLGKDAHKNTERIHLPYAIEIFPELLRYAVRRIAEEYRGEE